MIAFVIRVAVLMALIAASAVGAVLIRRGLNAETGIATAPRTETVTPSVGKTTADGSVTAPPLSTYAATLERPIFFEGRKVPQPPPMPPMVVETPKAPVTEASRPPPRAAPSAPTISESGLRLVGVVIQKDARRALIEVDQLDGQWFTVGGKTRDWTIERIESDRVVLRAGRQTTTLSLYAPQSAAPGRTTR